MCKIAFPFDKEMYKCVHLMRDLGIPEEKRKEYISQGYTFWTRLLGTTDCLIQLVEKQKGKTSEKAMKNIDNYFDEIETLKIKSLNQTPYQSI